MNFYYPAPEPPAPGEHDEAAIRELLDAFANLAKSAGPDNAVTKQEMMGKGMSERAINRMLHTLDEAGLLEVVMVRRPNILRKPVEKPAYRLRKPSRPEERPPDA